MVSFETIVQQYANIVIAHDIAIEQGTPEEAQHLSNTISNINPLFDARTQMKHTQRALADDLYRKEVATMARKIDAVESRMAEWLGLN